MGLIISKYVNIKKNKKTIIWLASVFVIHNILFIQGLSFKGDYPDYFVFSIEYLFLSVIIIRLYKLKDNYSKIFRSIGSILLVIGFLQGLIGILLFIVISQDYETDKIYNFNNNKKSYQTRRYSFGFVTSESIRYSFKTYRRFEYLPFELKINKIDFFDTKCDLNFNDLNFTVSINDLDLEFSSNGVTHKIEIE